MILLDTHAAVWFATDSALLGTTSRALADRALEEERLLISSISFWEIALLFTKGRLVMEQSTAELRLQLLDAGVTELAVTGPIGIRAVELERLHNDPADRLIAATAIIHDAALMTVDTALLRWQHTLQRYDASK